MRAASIRAALALTAGTLLLGACAGPAPYSMSGTDYASYELERAQREAALTGAPVGSFTAPVAAPTGFEPLAAATPVPIATPVPSAPPVPGGISSSELAAAGIGVAGLGVAAGGTASATPPVIGALPAPAAPSAAATIGTPVVPAAPATTPMATPVAAIGATPVPVVPQTPTAIGAATPAAAAPLPSWSAEADPLRSTGLEASPTNAAPEIVTAAGATGAPGASGPNIVQYALSAPNSVGQRAYSRFAFAGQGRASRNCASYPSPDEAQRDFLARGGPERDPRGLDPDGDGFACTWDPAPFRAAVGR